jgi:cupin 2 domain-containing protein
MAEEQLRRFLDKVRQLNDFVALSQSRPELLQALRECSHHHEVVALARSCGFEIGRRWGEPMPPPGAGEANLLSGACPPAGEETVTVLVQTTAMRLERIHSCSAASPPGFWYDQSEHEWVTLLQGSARILFADEECARDLGPGDTLMINAGRRHRVVATDPAPGTIWLALFWR